MGSPLSDSLVHKIGNCNALINNSLTTKSKQTKSIVELIQCITKVRKTCQVIKNIIVQLSVDCCMCNQCDGLDPSLEYTLCPHSESSLD